MIRSVLKGWGSYLPSKILTNADLAARVDTSDEWIRERTGIAQRHIAADHEYTSDLAFEAAKAALHKANLSANDIDLLLVATATPDETFPSTATIVQAKLGMTQGAAFDIHAVCSGFIYALVTADMFIKGGQARRVLVIGAETFSRLLDWEDRTTCVLFGDGAGAMIFEATQTDHPTGPGILASKIYSDGREHDTLYVDGGPSRTQTVGHLKMQGKQVFKTAVESLSKAFLDLMAAENLTNEQIAWVLPHQANQRIIEALAKRTGFPLERVISTVAHHANTSAASIPLAFTQAVDQKKIKSGDLILMGAMGAGFTWGVSALQL